MFITYDSLSKIEGAQHSAILPAPVFGLLIVDEAHAPAGTWEKNWTALHDNERIRPSDPSTSPPRRMCGKPSA
ncbi:hypothetical protein [Streptomyces sp. NPDC017991]|uniref:hypothetical protein n=1 Tax=Streptomyces sp. NPDC017991 TaxID=3365026 RepID=UPI00379CEFAA